jgi:hypothetical protein
MHTQRLVRIAKKIATKLEQEIAACIAQELKLEQEIAACIAQELTLLQRQPGAICVLQRQPGAICDGEN